MEDACSSFSQHSKEFCYKNKRKCLLKYNLCYKIRVALENVIKFRNGYTNHPLPVRGKLMCKLIFDGDLYPINWFGDIFKQRPLEFE